MSGSSASESASKSMSQSLPGPARVVCAGMSGMDRIMRVQRFATEATKIYAEGYDEVGGGPAATAAAAICRLGGEACLIGRVGDDPTGAAIRAELAACGVDVTALRVLPGAQSAGSNVTVDAAGERQITNFRGHGLDVEADWAAPEVMQGAGAALVDMGWWPGARRVLELARHAGIPSVLDADLGPDARAEGLLRLADHVVFSQAGLARMSEQDDPVRGLAWARRRLPGRYLGVTVGADGYAWLEDETLYRLPGHPIATVDTLGAGDVFHGAYALALAEGRTVALAAAFANAAAALKCARPSGRRGIPSRAEVDALLAGIEETRP
jgi:sulfofructose kinase